MRAQSPALQSATITLLLASSLLLQRFSVTFGERDLSFAVIFTLLVGLWMLGTGVVRINLMRLQLYLLAFAAMLVAAICGAQERVSAPAVGLLAAMYFLYTFEAPDETFYRTAIRVFLRFAAFIGVCGIVQFFAQIAIPGPTLFTFTDWIPERFMTGVFNEVIPVPGLPALNKANGFFLVEPSVFSQTMSLAIVVEIALGLVSWRLAIYVAGLFLSFSGTGLVLMAVALPPLLLTRLRAGLIFILPLLLIAVLVVAEYPDLFPVLDRADEFTNTRSSGFARFISPFYLFGDFVVTDLRRVMFGLGPGAIDDFFSRTDYTVHDPTWAKLLFEYGLVGGLPFLAFVGFCVFEGAPSLLIAAAVMTWYLFLGGYLAEARLEPIILCLTVLGRRRAARRVASRADPNGYIAARRAGRAAGH